MNFTIIITITFRIIITIFNISIIIITVDVVVESLERKKYNKPKQMSRYSDERITTTIITMIKDIDSELRRIKSVLGETKQRQQT